MRRMVEHLRGSLVVALGSDGLHLWPSVNGAPLALGFADLVLLSQIDRRGSDNVEALLSEVARETGAEDEQLRRLLDHLQAAGCLFRGGSEDRREPPQHAAAQPVDVDTDGAELCTPISFRLFAGGFETLDHDGYRVVLLSPPQLHALGSWVRDRAAGLESHRREAGRHALSLGSVRELLGRFARCGLVRPASSVGFEWRREFEAVVRGAHPDGHAHDLMVRATFERHAAEQDASETRRGSRRPKVIPVAFDMGPPAGLGSVVAFAKAFDGGRLDRFYDFRLDWVWCDDRPEVFTREPAIYLFSNYVWSHERCIEVLRQTKARSPNSITIHGGPDTPKYEADVRKYFRDFPHVDIAVHGEGELSAAETLDALRGVIGDEQPDLSVLKGVAGISYRVGDEVVRTADRPRIEDLDSIPSAYLTGLFDVYRQVPDLMVTLETNRGCPYGCTFCDWGSAISSRIRKFDASRVLAEIEWASAARAKSVSIADANYGIFERDLDFARHAADLRVRTGYPRGYGINFAKNTVKNLSEIVGVLAEAKILTFGVLALQSMDQSTLDAIRRSNIKGRTYDAIAEEMRRSQLPFMTELMMGLPGSTVESFRRDLQQCVDRELPARVNHTILLVNSPMNEPAYRAEHGIGTVEPVGPGRRPVLNSTSTYSAEDYGRMENLRVLNVLFETFGVLRLVSRFVRQEAGAPEMEFYDRLRSDAMRAEKWPTLQAVTRFGSEMMAPPVSWQLLIEDLADYLPQVWRLADDAALRSVLCAQHALLPAPGRSFPCVVDLAHDVTAWHRAVINAKEAGDVSSWERRAPRLREFGPGQLTVKDPLGVCEDLLGIHRELQAFGVNWELDSALSRARLQTQSAMPVDQPRYGEGSRPWA